MKATRKRGREGDDHVARDEQVRREIQCFLKALDSYPQRFLREPEISFEEHRRSIGRVALGQTARRQEEQKRTPRPA